MVMIFLLQIQLNQGGSFSALKEEPLRDWLKKKNPTYDVIISGFSASIVSICKKN